LRARCVLPAVLHLVHFLTPRASFLVHWFLRFPPGFLGALSFGVSLPPGRLACSGPR
jgi:hypothetical protein